MTGEPHRHFHDELARLKERLLHMSGRAESAVEQAMQAFLNRDKAAAETVLSGDAEIDALELEMDNTVTSLLARHQPVAKDLRLVLVALKISNDLERVGDHAVNIAESAMRMAATRPFPQGPELAEMAGKVQHMLSTALSAFVRGDAQAGRAVCREDDDVDNLHASTFRFALNEMAQHPEHVQAAMELFRVSHNLERVADLATNVAEDVVFLVEGTSIKHHAEEKTG